VPGTKTPAEYKVAFGDLNDFAIKKQEKPM